MSHTPQDKDHARDITQRTLAFTRALLHKDQEGVEALRPTNDAEAIEMLTAAAGTILFLIDEREDVLNALQAAHTRGTAHR